MKQKNLLYFGLLIATASPLVTVVACSSNLKSDVEKQLAKVKEQYNSQFSVQGIKDHIENIADDGEVDLASIGIAQAQFDQVDQGWTLKYYLDGKAASYADNDLILKAKVTKNDDTSISKQKDVSIKPIAKDIEKPVINIPRQIKVNDQTKDINWTNESGKLAIAPTANLTKNHVEDLFIVSDNSGEKIKPTFTWKEQAQEWNEQNFATEGTYNAIISAKDSANQEAKNYTLIVQVSQMQKEIDKVDENPAPTKSTQDLKTALTGKGVGTVITDYDSVGVNIKQNDQYDYQLTVKEPWEDGKEQAVLNLKVSKHKVNNAINFTSASSAVKEVSKDITITGISEKMWDQTSLVGGQLITVDPTNPLKASVTLEVSSAPDKTIVENEIKLALDNNDDSIDTITWNPEYKKEVATYIATLNSEGEEFIFTISMVNTVQLKWDENAIVGGQKITIDELDQTKASVNLNSDQLPSKKLTESQITAALNNIPEGIIPLFTWETTPELLVATIQVASETFTFTIKINVQEQVKWDANGTIADIPIVIDQDNPIKAKVTLNLQNAPGIGDLGINLAIKNAFANLGDQQVIINWNTQDEENFDGIYDPQKLGIYQAIINIEGKMFTLDITIEANTDTEKPSVTFKGGQLGGVDVVDDGDGTYSVTVPYNSLITKEMLEGLFDASDNVGIVETISNFGGYAGQAGNYVMSVAFKDAVGNTTIVTIDVTVETET